MALIAVQQTTLVGLKPAYSAAAELGDKFVNSGNCVLFVKNGAVAARTVTIDSVAACDQGHDHNIAVAVPASEERMIGPFNRVRFNDVDGNVNMTYDDHTDVTLAIIEVP
jgi:hypothetical protein